MIAKQAHSELLDRVANFCGLERGDPEQKRVMGMKHPNYHDPARATINLALPWHSVADKIADLNLKIVDGHINILHITWRATPVPRISDFTF